jgi:hypothetical protein
LPAIKAAASGVEDKALVQAARAAGVAGYQYLPSGMHVVECHKAPLAPDRAAQLTRRFLVEGRIETRDGEMIPLSADSICVHGDGATAAAVVRTIRDVLAEATSGRSRRPGRAARLGHPLDTHRQKLKDLCSLSRRANVCPCAVTEETRTGWQSRARMPRTWQS